MIQIVFSSSVKGLCGGFAIARFRYYGESIRPREAVDCDKRGRLRTKSGISVHRHQRLYDLFALKILLTGVYTHVTSVIY
jgi:hypothetical protein